MKINILMGPFYPIPPTRGLALERMQFALAHEYIRLGCAVTMVSRQFEDRADDEVVDGVRHLRLPSSDEPGHRVVYRAKDALYAWRACRAMPDADVTVTNSVSAPLLVPRRCGPISISVNRYPKGQMGLYRRAARLVAPSQAIAAAIAVQTPSAVSRTRVIPNPLSAEFASAATDLIAKRSVPERGCEILFVGRVAREKGVHLLVDAFRQIADDFPDWRLSLIGPVGHEGGGDGWRYLDELKTSAAPLGDRVRFEGPVYDQAVLIKRMQRAGLFVYPSIAEKGEAFGVAPVEAMASGCPVILSNLDCFKDFLNADTGVAFDHRRDPVAHLAKACRVLMSSASERHRLGLGALQASQPYFPERVARTMLSDFEELIGQSSNAGPS